MSLYKQLSNRKWPDDTRWREREPGYNSRDIELPRMLGKMVEVGSVLMLAWMRCRTLQDIGRFFCYSNC